MAPSKTAKSSPAAKTKQEGKKEKIFHPSSRKSGQLTRHAHRKDRLENLASKRHKKHNLLVDVYGFFYHAIPADGALTLEELHNIIREVWLTRFDEELEQEIATRRKGRPKSVRQAQLEGLKLREAEEYRTGMEVPDLTHYPTVEIFRRWDQKEAAFPELLRFIRISSSLPDKIVVSKPGKHLSITGSTIYNTDETMCVDQHSCQ